MKHEFASKKSLRLKKSLFVKNLLVPLRFEDYFHAYFTSGSRPRTQNLCLGYIFDGYQDGSKLFQKFENFKQSRN